MEMYRKFMRCAQLHRMWTKKINSLRKWMHCVFKSATNNKILCYHFDFSCSRSLDYASNTLSFRLVFFCNTHQQVKRNHRMTMAIQRHNMVISDIPLRMSVETTSAWEIHRLVQCDNFLRWFKNNAANRILLNQSYF